MNSIWLRDLACYGLQVVVLVGAGALLAHLFRFRASALTLVYWQGLLALCLILPVCQRWRPTSAGTPEMKPSLAATVHAAFPASSVPAGVPPSKPWPIERVALMILMGGIVTRGLWLAAGFRSLARLGRDSDPPPVALRPVLAAAEREVGVRADFRTSERAAAPITFGLRRPIVLLPPSLGAMEAETQRAIVYHELVHVRRRDWTCCVAEEFVRSALWFHPAIWWLVGRIHLSREQLVDQVVVGLTASRERYVEALLAVAEAKIHGLIPAPPFLRRGLLKKRVAEILKETTMTTRRLILVLVVSAGALFLVARIATTIFPLRAHAQEFGSAPIQVVQGGENLVHRSALVYPHRAIERHVEGDVVLEVSVDEQGQVSDARVVSGPEELRRACLQSVLEWRYHASKSAPASTQVMIHFQLPAEGAPSEIVLPAAPEEREDAAVRYFVMTDRRGAAAAARKMKELEEKMQSTGATAEDKANYELQLAKLKAQLPEDAERAGTWVADPPGLAREADELRAKIADSGTPPEDRAKLKKELAERLADTFYIVSGNEDEAPVSGRLTAIRTERLPQATLDALSPRLGVQVGDTIDEETAQKVRETVRQTLGEQFRALFHITSDGGVELVIVGP
jgi:TonB family protein